MEEAERERLRRSLYRPDATEADRARYASSVPIVEAAAPQAGSATGASRRRLPAVLVGVLVLAGAAVIAWPVVAGSAPPTDREAVALPTSSAAPSGSVLPPDARLMSITYTDAGVVQAFHGRGTATVRLDDDVMPHAGGRLSVVLAPSDTALIGWEVRRAVPAEGAADQVLASRSVTEVRGVAVPIVFPFDGRPPTTVAVHAPGGIAWSLVVTSLRGATAR